MARQYLTVKFRPKDSRAYTYHWDGVPVKVGDLVKIPGKLPTDSWTALPVLTILPPNYRPPFDTKAMLGLAPPKAEAGDRKDGGGTPDLFNTP